MSAAPNPILLYDGVCGLCNRFVQFVLRHDKHDRFRFAALQSDFAATRLQQHGLNPQALDTVVVITDHTQPSEQLSTRSDAVIVVLREFNTFWRAAATLLSLVPRPIRDWGYNRVARNRYRIFGKFDVCPMPNPGDRHKFLDQP